MKNEYRFVDYNHVNAFCIFIPWDAVEKKNYPPRSIIRVLLIPTGTERIKRYTDFPRARFSFR